MLNFASLYFFFTKYHCNYSQYSPLLFMYLFIIYRVAFQLCVFVLTQFFSYGFYKTCKQSFTVYTMDL